MNPAVIALTDADGLAGAIAGAFGTRCHTAVLHTFPDGETGVRIDPAAAAPDVLVVASLDHPNPKLVPLLFLARILREYGAGRILLVAPYLAYMRQDRRFRDGDGVSARYFADLLSAHFDGLVTVDAHLHRIRCLGDVYTVPAVNVHAAPAVAEWIGACVDRPLIVGPDSESGQWVEEVGRLAGAPVIVLEKQRRGDSDVAVSVPDVEHWQDHTPVLFDDIIATGRSMAATVAHLQRLRMKPPVCVGVHAIFAGDAERILSGAGAAQVVTTNTVAHPSNGIDMTPAISAAVRDMLRETAEDDCRRTGPD